MFTNSNTPGGLGTATAKLLRSQGSSLALLYAPFEASKRQQVLEESYGSADQTDIKTYECDITSQDSVKQAFSALNEHSQSSDSPFPSILINAAGFVSTSPLEDQSIDVIQTTFNANLLGPMLLSQAFARFYWQRQANADGKHVPPGRIVSISSQAAHVALPNHGAYCASKAGLMGLTRCMASEWGSRGITANTVSPTVALTALGKKAWEDPTMREAMFKQIPTGRFAEPEEIAEAIMFLCQDSSGMINGSDIRIDGGFTIQ